MKYFSQVFSDMMHLYVGTNSKCFHEYRDYFHVESVFGGEWYNFVVPKLRNPNSLDIKEINQLIEKEKANGKNISLYINRELLDNYKSFLEKNKYSLYGDEVYLIKTLGAIKEVELSEGYTIDTKYELEKVTAVLEKCFPDWPEESAYSKIYEEYKKVGQEDRLFETMVVHFKDEIVGASSISLDKTSAIVFSSL